MQPIQDVRLWRLLVMFIASAMVWGAAPVAGDPPGVEDAKRADDAIAAVVVIETFHDERPLGPRVAFLAAPGEVITNRHCIEGATRARIRLHDERVFDVRGIIAESASDDVVVLVLDATPEELAALPMLPFATVPAAARERVRLLRRDVGSLEPIVTEGEIREIRNDVWHGTDIVASARSEAGASGSPLVNVKGEVVGVVRSGAVGFEHQMMSSAAPAAVVADLARGEVLSLADWWAIHDRPGWREGMAELRLADSLQSRGMLARATRHAKRALGHDPKLGRAWALIARAHFASGQYKDAAAAVRKWTEVEPERAGAWLLLGSMLHFGGELEEALMAFQRSMELLPSAEGAGRAASVLGELGRDDEANEMRLRALELEPERAHTWYLVGLGQHRLFMFDEAMVSYGRAAELAPEDGRPRFWIAQLHRMEHDLARAEEWLRKAIEAEPGMHASYCALGQLLMDADRLDEAKEMFSEAVRGNSSCRVALRGLARCARAADDAETAEKWLARLGALPAGAGGDEWCQPER